MDDEPDTPFTPCPDFELAPLGSFPKAVFSPERPADAFVLVLSVAFNDLKGMMWWIEQLNNCRPTRFAVEPYTGQWQGMHVQAKRYLAGILHELLEATDSAARSAILSDATFAAAVANSGGPSKAAWEDLVAVATRQPAATDIRRALNTARNRAAFHYDRARLRASYQRHFISGSQTEYTAAAFVSLGRTLEQTRFFYADAVADDALGFAEQEFREINRHMRGMNRALRNIVEQYLLLRQGEINGEGRLTE